MHLGSNVVWYAYRRIDGGLYLQKSVSGVLGPETLVAAPVDYIDTIIDTDGTRAWIYFTCDGALRAIEITTLTETPSTQVFQRSPGWHERANAGLGGGGGIISAFGFTDETDSSWRTDDGPVELYPPKISLLDVGSPTQLLLLIEPGSVTFGNVDKFRTFKMSDHDGAGWSWYSDVVLPGGAIQASLLVPKSVFPTVNQWVATAVRYRPADESAWSNIISEGDFGDAVTSKLGGPGTEHSWDLTNKTPKKYASPNDEYAPGRLGGQGTENAWAQTNKTPKKYASPNDEYSVGKLGGAGTLGSWALNGVGVITP